jgi:hypothetical protein
MRSSEFGRYPQAKKKISNKSTDDIINELKKNRSPREDYRERSLKIHGLICARCGREFDWKNRHQLTIHHKDGNHLNNPSDGSNWENLCVYCHDDEHRIKFLAEGLKEDR